MGKTQLCCVLMILTSTAPVFAQGPVHFPDANLEAAVEQALWMSDPTPTDLLGLVDLRSIQTDIVSLTGLEYAENLQKLNLRFNRIADVSPLAGLKNLRELVLNNNRIDDVSRLSGLTGLRFLDLHGNQISNIAPLSGMVNLQRLIIHDNQISDLSALSGMKDLIFLDLFGNRIRDLEPISGLHRIETLVLSANRINNVSDLSGLVNLKTLSLKLNGLDGTSLSGLCGLTELQRLNLAYNHIKTLSGLVCLQGLRELDLNANPLSQQDYCNHLQTVFDNNPVLGLESGLSYPPNCVPPSHVLALTDNMHNRIRISWSRVCSGPCYTSHYQVYGATTVTGPKIVLSPWRTSHALTLDPIAGTPYNYYWVRTATDSQGVNAGAYSEPIQVRSMPTGGALFVDDDSEGDGGPGDAAVGDPLEDGSVEHPFDTIQEALDAAFDHTRVIVRPGVYRETIDFLGKQIELTGIDPNDPDMSDFPVIDGAGAGPVVKFTQGEDPNCVMTGFVITRGQGDLAGALTCQDSSPTISNCLIVGNRAVDPNGGAVYCLNSNAVFDKCTIANNVGGAAGGALVMDNSSCSVRNTIVWDNVPQALVLIGVSDPQISYTDIAGVPGPGNLEVAPLFTSPGYWAFPGDPDILLEPGDPAAVWVDGDYHLLSEAGRWDPTVQDWLYDQRTSPCIDAGDPADPTGYERIPHGDTVNMGVYGGTIQASKSL